jgi:hypothetical protein
MSTAECQLAVYSTCAEIMIVSNLHIGDIFRCGSGHPVLPNTPLFIRSHRYQAIHCQTSDGYGQLSILGVNPLILQKPGASPPCRVMLTSRFSSRFYVLFHTKLNRGGHKKESRLVNPWLLETASLYLQFGHTACNNQPLQLIRNVSTTAAFRPFIALSIYNVNNLYLTMRDICSMCRSVRDQGKP